MSTRKHIPPRVLLTRATPGLATQRALNDMSSILDGYTPVLCLVPDDAPEVDYTAEYESQYTNTLAVVSPPVWSGAAQGWRVMARDANGSVLTTSVSHITKIEPEPEPEPTYTVDQVRDALDAWWEHGPDDCYSRFCRDIIDRLTGGDE